MSRLRILALEPYYGGSHRAVLDGLVERIDAEWTVLTLPARKWKWRMRGAAMTMAAEANAIATEARRARSAIDSRRGPWDLVFASTFLNLAEFRGLTGVRVAAVPAIVYFHENQLVYPNRHTAEWDFQFPLTNITSALSAERCVFNTSWNRDRFLEEIPGFLKQFPDHVPGGVAERIAEKSEVLAPPFDPAPLDRALGPRGVAAAPRGDRPRVVWPHRWEHDKDPEAFFAVVSGLFDEGFDFEVAVAGQVFGERPDVFAQAEAHLGDRLVHLGEPEDRDAYARLLASADIAVSTARNEFFGLAMVEASYAGCFPLVPDRLAYPEIYPAEMRYAPAEELRARIRSLLVDRPAAGAARHIAERYTFGRLAESYLSMFREVAGV